MVAGALIVALAAAALEAITHHGLDNFTVQVGASAAAWALG
jgi:dolichol kinase